jgi:glycosyltransferase involved in cell wall biosynthesis
MAEQFDSDSKTNGKKNIRPVLIASPRCTGEYSLFVRHLLAGLADESIRAAVVCSPDCHIEPITPPGIEIINHPAIALPLLNRYNRKILAEKLSKLKPTVLHCLCETMAPLTRKLARKMALPYMMNLNSIQKPSPLLNLFSKRLTKIIVPADSIAQNIKKFRPGSAQKVLQINYGSFTSEENNCFSNTSHITTILLANPFQPNTDFDTVLAAMRHLNIEGYEFSLAVLAPPKKQSYLRGVINAMGFSQSATIAPSLKPWRSLLKAADIFIQPQPNPFFNPFLLEAMSAGAAVAACKGGADDLIIEDKTAAVFDPEDELSVYAALKRLLDSHQLARQFASEAQELIRQEHSVSKMIEAYIQTYADAAQSR